jgi:hypothetical protein
VRAFPVRLPSGVRYWTVLDEDLAVVAEADAFLRHVDLVVNSEPSRPNRCVPGPLFGPLGSLQAMPG